MKSRLNGVVVNRFNSKGEYVDVEPVMVPATLDPLHVDLLLPASYFGKITKGQNLMIKPDSDGIQERGAKVIIVDPLIDPASGTFRVQLEMKKPGSKIPAGISCTAKTLATPVNAVD